MSTAISREVIEELRKYDSPTICNVIELFGYQPRNVGWVHKDVAAVYPELPPMVGFAVTATFRSATAGEPGEKAIGLADQLEAFESVPGPRVVVIQDLDDPPCGAVYGEVMVSSYRGFGAVGLVTNGYARDVLQIKPLEFPCFASGYGVSHSYCRVLSVQKTVDIGGLTIRPGMLLHGDANGVAAIPLEIAAEVAGACAEFVAAEDVVIAAARQSKPTLAAYREASAEFNRRRTALTERLQKRATQSNDGEAMA